MLLSITGNNRSGTTLVQRLCDSHPEVRLTNEFGGLFYLGNTYEEYRQNIFRLWWKAKNRPFFRGESLWDIGCYHPITMEKQHNSWRYFIAKYSRIYMVQNFVFVSRYLKEIKAQSPKRIKIEVLEKALQETFKVTVVGDNHPDYVFSLDNLAKQNLSRIVIYRDPRDVTSDVLKRLRIRSWHNENFLQRDLRKWWPNDLKTAKQIAKRWVSTIESIDKYADALCIIKYEDVVTQPKRVVKQLSDWLDVDPNGFDQQIIHIGGAIGTYQNGLSKQELQDVIDIAKTTMTRLGYQCH